MNENINLCEILKGYEGYTFYSSILGYVELVTVNNNNLSYPIKVEIKANGYGYGYLFTSTGLVYDKYTDAECVLFPSKEQRDWNKWIEEQKLKGPKTYSELKNQHKYDSYVIKESGSLISVTNIGNTPIEKSALAILKIHQLIEVGYGGHANKVNEFYSISYDVQDKKFIVYKYKDIIYDNFIISFHTEKQANEFLSYPENVQLLKDYFML